MKNSLKNLWVLVFIVLPSYSIGNDSPLITLKVSPHLCLRYAKTDTCKINVQLTWTSNTGGDFCLYSSDKEAPLECWNNQTSGSITERKLVKDDVRFWVSRKGSRIILAHSDLKIATLVNNKKREIRQRRHIWSLI